MSFKQLVIFTISELKYLSANCFALLIQSFFNKKSASFSSISELNSTALHANHKCLKACNPSTINPEANNEDFPYLFIISSVSITSVKGA